MLDITLLRIMKYKKDFIKLNPSIPKDTLDLQTQAIITDFGKYFEKFPEHDKIDLQVFLPAFKRWHPTIKDEQLSTYISILGNVNQDVDDCTKDGVLDDLFELALGTKVANLCMRYEEGDLETPLGLAISNEIDSYKIKAGIDLATWIDDPIEDLLQEDIDESGIKWRLKCLRNSMRPLRGGDFGIIAGRPDKGKTTFIASEVTNMANQLAEQQNILWLNNEGPGKRILPRLYQAALGKSLSDIIQMSNAGTLVKAYTDIVGRRDKIRVIDVHGWHVGQVETVLDNMNPGVVIFDMIDHLKGFGSEARTDLALEEMYKWARERAVKYNCVCLATSQISADGDGEMYPGLSMLKDSKTGKQGAAEFQIMIGASNAPELSGRRYISLPKNKIRRDGFPGDPRQEVIFSPEIARYEDVNDG